MDLAHRITRARRSEMLLVVPSLLCAVGLGFAQDDPPAPAQNHGNAAFYAIADLTYIPEPQPSLLEAQVVDTKKWPASFFSVSDAGTCTSTLLGPRTLLTAAHCVGDGKTARISKSDRFYEGTCRHAPEYAGNRTADWALCYLNADVLGVQYETLHAGSTPLRLGDAVLLTGFGCKSSAGSTDGLFRAGTSTVRALPSRANYDTVTLGGAALCFGDSGGAAYVTGENDSRRVIAVNSRGNIADRSHLSSTYVESARAFIAEWSKSNGAVVCGVHSSAGNCR